MFLLEIFERVPIIPLRMFESSKKNVTLLTHLWRTKQFRPLLLPTTPSYFRTRLRGLSKMFERPEINFGSAKVGKGDGSLKNAVCVVTFFFLVHFLYSKLMKSPPFPKRDFIILLMYHPNFVILIGNKILPCILLPKQHYP